MIRYHQLMSASSLDGDDVKNLDGQSLGNVKDIMLDTDNGTIAYYVLSFGGFMGMGDKYFAIPPEAMTLDTKAECFILNVSKEQLKNAPGFDKDNWPNMADPAFRDEIYSYYEYDYRSAA